MPEREIKTSVGTYINEAGVSGFGFKGDTVHVHEDHVDRFDELNVDSGDPVEPERVGVDLISPAPEPEPKKAAPAKKST